MAPFKMVNNLSPNERRAKIHDTKYLQSIKRFTQRFYDILTVLFFCQELIQADNIHPSLTAAPRL